MELELDLAGNPVVPVAELLPVRHLLEAVLKTANGQPDTQTLSLVQTALKMLRDQLPPDLPPLEPFRVVTDSDLQHNGVTLCPDPKRRTVMPVKLPHELSREALLAIVAGVQGRMYLDMDGSGRETWNPDKEWSGADLCMELQNLLHQHGLVPGHKQDYHPMEQIDCDDPVREPQLIICLDGGFVRDVYSSLPDIHVVIVDWDVADTIIDSSLLKEDPKVLTVETSHGEVYAAVHEVDVTPISDASGTDLETVIVAAKHQDFISADVPMQLPRTCLADEP